MENNSNTSANETLGAFLKRQREAKNISIKDLALRTRINSRIIKDLESDHYQNLPDRIYVKGFIKSFAKELKFSLEEAFKLVDRDYPLMSSQTTPVVSSSVSTHHPLSNSSEESEEGELPDVLPVGEKLKISKKIFVILLVFLAIFAIFKGLQKIYLGIKEQASIAISPTPSEDKPLETNMVTLAVPTPIPTILSTPMTNALPAVINIPVSTPTTPVASVTPVETPTPVQQEESKIKKIEFKKYSSNLFHFKDEKENESEFLSEVAKESVEDGMQTVYINATDGDCWITYKEEQKSIKVVMLTKGSDLLIKSKEVRLFLGNPKAVRVYNNSRQVVLNTNTGVKSLVFPAANTKKYLFPLFVHDAKGKIFTGEEFKKMQDGPEANSVVPLQPAVQEKRPPKKKNVGP